MTPFIPLLGYMVHSVQSRDVDPVRLNPDPDPELWLNSDPDPIRIQGFFRDTLKKSESSRLWFSISQGSTLKKEKKIKLRKKIEYISWFITSFFCKNLGSGSREPNQSGSTSLLRIDVIDFLKVFYKSFISRTKLIEKLQNFNVL